MVEPVSLSLEGCRSRQGRLSRALAERDIDRAIITSHENIQYLSGFRPHRLMQAALCLTADGQCSLSAPNSEPESAAVDAVVTFPAQWHSTLRQEQTQVALGELHSLIAGQSDSIVQRTGIELSCNAVLTREWIAAMADADSVVDIDPLIWELRRNKDRDELAMIMRAIECTQAMYERAREIIRPGISELTVYNELHAAAVEIAGEPLTALGNDYQCHSPGGAPRPRAAQAGELFILDLGPAYRGYYADNCRTFSVDGSPTDEQLAAREAVLDALTFVESFVRPGASCRELFNEVQSRLDEFLPAGFTHHLGHGFGLFPHEAPHLNPHWDDVFAEGDTFTAEPGLYSPSLKGGLRIEQNYQVTGDGVELLTPFDTAF